MVPVAQSILTDSFPLEKRGQGFALFGFAVVVAPVVGPTLRGWLSDNLSWHWCFLINGPVGVLTVALIAALLLRCAARARPAQGEIGRAGSGRALNASKYQSCGTGAACGTQNATRTPP